MAHHTKGPWHLGVGDNLRGNRVWTADIRPIVNLCTMGQSPPDIDPQAQANGRLIAAAPDLLASLRALTDWMRDNTGPHDSSHDALVTAMAAIAKAENA